MQFLLLTQEQRASVHYEYEMNTDSHQGVCNLFVLPQHPDLPPAHSLCTKRDSKWQFWRGNQELLLLEDSQM